MQPARSDDDDDNDDDDDDDDIDFHLPLFSAIF